MITREDYNALYTLYTESINLQNRLSLLDVKLRTVQETSDIEIIKEGAIDVLKRYMEKVIESLQGVINKLREKVCKDRRDNFLKKYPKEKIMEAISKNLEPVKVQNFRDQNIDTLIGIDLKEIKSLAELEGLPDTKEEYLKKQYGGTFYKDEKQNIRENIRNYITVKKYDEFSTDSNSLNKMLNFLVSGLDRVLDTIEKNANIINDFAKFAETNFNSVTSNVKQESVSTFDETLQYYFSEAEGEDEKTKIVSDDKEDENKPEDKSKNNVSKFTYVLKVNTEIMMSQTALADSISSLYVNILTRYMKGSTSSEKENPSDKDTENEGIQRGSFKRLK